MYMARKVDMRIPISQIPQEIIDLHDLMSLVHNGYVLVKISMFGLPQSGLLANKQLVLHLPKHDYIPTKHTLGLFKHKTNGISFNLCEVDFGIEYVSKESAHHLEIILWLKYKLTTDWTGSRYLGLTLN